MKALLPGKTACIIVLLSVIISAFCSCDSNYGFVLRPGSDYSVVTGQSPDSLTLKAAEELQRYFFLVTGKELRVTDTPGKTEKIICIGAGSTDDKEVLASLETLDSEGFLIVSSPGRLFIGGNNGMADLYAVYTLFEEFAGCMRFTEKEEYIQQAGKITVPSRFKEYEPAFSFRIAHFPDREKPGFTAWNKLSTFSEWGMFVHTFQQLMPPSVYFNEHPEYFSLVNGKRIQDGQLCLSNPEVISLLAENLRKRMDESPGKKYWSVSQNDCINFCECPACKKLYERYGTVSGAYIEMANKLAAIFPDKQISTLAYQFTRQAPQNIVPAPNVNVMFCSIECNRSMALADDPRSAAFVKDLADWSRLTSNIFMWDYVVQFRTYLCPFPNIHTLQPNIMLFHKYNVPMMFQQGSGRSWSDLTELKQYLIAKLLWDPTVDADSVINRFISAYYGDAAPYIREYQNLSQAEMKKVAATQNLDIYGLPSYYFGTFLSRELLTRYHELMDKAENAVASDSARLPRVLRARMAVDFAWLDYALNAGDTNLSFIKNAGEGKTVNEDMMSQLDRVLGNSVITGVTAVSEHNYSLSEYREHVRRIVAMGVRENKVRPAELRSLTSFHPRYSEMGAASLADGIFGGRTFSSGWLGYEDNDMIIEINPETPVEISKISMNFLSDHVSWIFLPTEVKIEVSENGTDYMTVASETITTEKFIPEIIPVSREYSFDPVTAKKIRITAVSMKKCPEWHRGAGLPAWIFIDEIVVQ